MLLLSVVSFFTTTFVSLAAFVKYQNTDELAYGKIGLRSYFHCGSGSEEDPYVITRPRHLYNLSRLQTLGVFPKKCYFQLGYQIDQEHFGFYQGDTSTYSKTLDMKDMPITSIGSEATPFYGCFEGNGMTIENLTVNAILEDSGMFGYVACQAEVKNFLLDEVKITNSGYTKDFDTFYSKDAEKSMKKKTSFVVRQGEKKVTYTYIENNLGELENHYVPENLTLSGSTAAFQLDENGSMPQFQVINNTTSDLTYSRYTYSLLASDLFLQKDKDDSIFKVNPKQDTTSVQDIFTYFEKLENNTDITLNYPLNLSMTISGVASNLDSLGINHAKVISSLNLSFEKKSKDSSTITLYVQPRDIQHGNNIGLVIGHLDGSCQNVFVHNGSFSLNGEKANTPVAQKSMTGFIGLIGPSVYDKASQNAKGDVAIAGKDVGVLDFTDIYNSIIDQGFTHQTTTFYGRNDYYSYTPKTPDQGNEYYDYLRFEKSKSDTTRYTTTEKNLQLIGKTIIQDDDSHNRGLGVFRIATDYMSKGYGDSLFSRSEKSRIVKAKTYEDNTTTSCYMKQDATHVFYSTFEYVKDNQNRYNQRKKDVFTAIESPIYNEYYPTTKCILNGNYIPTSTSETSQELFEAYYNYLFRFTLDQNRTGFYFNNLDETTIGGRFLSDYFRYKLVDEEGNPIGKESSQFGLMIKNKNRENIEELTTAFPLDRDSPDYMYVFNQDENKPKENNILKEQTTYAVANSINFEIKTEKANVTILASNREGGSYDRDTMGSVLGIYRLGEYLTKNNSADDAYIQCDSNGTPLKFDDPDYAMALPANKTISYFSYTKDGKIGASDLNDNNFEELTQTNYIQSVNLSEDTSSSYTASLDAPIFAHTFCLPKGRYCLGSACGTAYVYYVCAQGQDEGDITMSANVYNSQNRVENIDFVKDTTGLFTTDHEKGIIVDEQTMQKKRLYLIFDSGNVTKFNAATKNGAAVRFTIRMEYRQYSFRFIIPDGSLDGLSNIALVNYRYRLSTGSKNVKVDLFDGLLVSDKNKISYKR